MPASQVHSWSPPTSRHALPVYPNLARGIIADAARSALGRRHHLHPAARGFVYLAVMLDAFSRGSSAGRWSHTLEAELAVAALRHGARSAQARAGSLIHHSDRGVQYACADYRRDRLERNGITLSMSRPGNPYDNAKAESFMKTLKNEESQRASLRRYRTTPAAASPPSSKTSTTPTACTRRSATARRLSSKPRSRKTKHDNASWQPHCHCNYRVSFKGCSPALSPQFPPQFHVLPERLRPIEPDGVGLLNFNDASAAQAPDAKVARDLREPTLLDLGLRLSSRADRPRGSGQVSDPADARLPLPFFPSALGWGMRQLAVDWSSWE